VSSDGTRGAQRPVARETGYSLVALVVILVVVNIAVAAAMPLWSNVVQRDREAELLFRGWQYAEAIRVFQTRYGRYPVRLEELIEVKPRCIRQLWTDPLSDSGAWEPILAGSGQPVAGEGAARLQRQGTPGQELAAGRRPGRPTIQAQAGESPSKVTAFDPPDRGGPPGRTGDQIGPIEGVRPTATGTALKSFLGRTDYGEWEFRATMLAGQTVSAQGVPRSPRIGFESLTRPFPSSLATTTGALPGATPGTPAGFRPTPDAGDDDDN